MISDAVLVAMITASASIICQIIINHNNRKKQKSESAEEQKKKAVEEALKEERRKQEMKEVHDQMAEIIERLDIHNGYAEKLGTIEKSIVQLDTQMKVLLKGAV